MLRNDNDIIIHILLLVDGRATIIAPEVPKKQIYHFHIVLLFFFFVEIENIDNLM